MRIDRIELQIIRLPLREPFRISSGTAHRRRILLLKLDAQGLRGYGECVAENEPYYSAETVTTARYVLECFLIPAVIGREFADAGALARALETRVRGHAMAKAAVEMAAWDLEAKLRDLPLARLLGGTRAAVPVGVSLGIQPALADLLERVQRYRAQGYRRIKLKIAPGWDVEVLRCVRERFPELPLTADANAAYDASEHARLKQLDEFGLLMLEQPFAADDLLAHARLQAELSTAVCLDESITSRARCAEALHLKSCRVVNIKPGRLGGHAAARAVHDLCQEAGVPVWCGGMLESGIGRAHNVALASLANFRYPGDISASDRYWERDVVDPPFALRADGTLAVPTGPGIGVRVDEDFLAAIQEERASFPPI
ncbi:MAG: o-succinylbenzoate synthase [Gemmatimonadetes bacterium]|nr:o-succinylbenzoate synthase [Gemmatimonadota bacterium]